MEWRGKRILVTGGDGFIGSHLVAKLDGLGAEVTVASKNKSGKGTFICIDVTTPSLNFEKYEAVFHLAGIADPRACEQNPEQAFLVNSYGSLNVMEACRRSGVERILLSSSAHVYGIPQYTPIDEKHSLKPVSVYGRSKVAAEHICKSYGATILRFFNIYGEEQRGDYLIPTIISNLEEESITLRNLDSKRDFVYVDDVVDAMLLAVDHPNKCFNIGSGIGQSPKEVAELLFKISGKHPKLTSLNKPDSVPVLVAGIGKAKKELGWEPKVKLEEGLRRVYGGFE
ncbi:NAD-dependent epimerase/dehydratase family protein, partial [Candidatus Micrarchaeota archaeon]|nr:NAD-dependent epimerase/dehydratase family protein [Candidatus Micrarchaeota archaeon]